MGLSPVTRYAARYAEILDSFRSFVRRELEPLGRQSGVAVGEPVPADLRSFVRERSARLGFYAAEYPEHAGGQNLPFAAKTLLYELAESTGCPLAPQALCGPAGPSPLLLHATEEQRERWLRPLVAGTTTRCLAVTEPAGGSDVTGTSSTATPEDGGWRLRGSKCFVSNAHEAELVLVLVRLTTATGDRVPVIFVLAADHPGVVIGPPRPGLGEDLLCDVFLDDVLAGDDALLGGRAAIGSHQGWITRALARGRVVVAATSNGIAARALALGVEFTRTRRSLGAPIGSHQHVQEHVVASRLELEGARLLTLAAAEDLDDGDAAVEQASLAKLAATDGACRTVDRMFQVHGATAWLRGHPLEYLYRHARAARLVEGTSEVQKVILAAAEGLS
ncbi:acyl-CoA dehydrogenase family protein [Amycolatopsis mediterranei]|uniref:acyl-CoA dehydrogenase family protein n=1 Tax=Amycolatopsis mediterranei TaxID=33910 RepID=UPI00343DB50F